MAVAGEGAARKPMEIMSLKQPQNSVRFHAIAKVGSRGVIFDSLSCNLSCNSPERALH